MTELTTNPNDPRLGHGSDSEPNPQNQAYLVLSEEERQRGFVRPVRHSYRHVGKAPKYPLRDLTDEEKERYGDYGYVKFEVYPEDKLPQTGRFWTQKELSNKGCNTITTMGQAIAETYARNPHFYGATYCVHCQMHLPVDEFVWEGTDEVVGS